MYAILLFAIPIFCMIVCFKLFHWWGLLIGVFVGIVIAVFVETYLGPDARKKKEEEERQKKQKETLDAKLPELEKELAAFRQSPDVQRLIESVVNSYFYNPKLPPIQYQGPSSGAPDEKTLRQSGSFSLYLTCSEELVVGKAYSDRQNTEVFKYAYTDGGFRNQTDAKKRMFLLLAVTERIAEEYIKENGDMVSFSSQPRLKDLVRTRADSNDITYENTINLYVTFYRDALNPNYNKTAW